MWRTLGALKTDKALELLALTLNTAKESDDVIELAKVLVRSQAPQSVQFVRSQLFSSRGNPKRKVALETALREAAVAAP